MRYKIKIKTLTGIHISNGDELEVYEYFKSGDKFYYLNANKIYKKIFDKNDGIINTFNNWINSKTFQIANSHQQQKNKDIRLSPIDFLNEKLRDKNMLNEIKQGITNGDLAFYHIQQNYISSTKKVKTLIKTASKEVYIPGSSLKGVFRTALLSDIIFSFYNTDPELKKIFDSSISDLGTNLKREKEEDQAKKLLAKKLEDYCFVCGDKDGKKDAKYYVFKFIKISDSNSKQISESCRLSELKLLKYNGKTQSQLPAFEVIKDGEEFESILEIDVKGLKAVANYKSKNKSSKEWQDFDNVIDRAFNLSIDKIINDSEEAIADKIKSRFNDIINDFCVLLVNSDLKWWGDKVGYADKLDNFPDSAVKIGFGSGFEATTIYSVFLDEEFNFDKNKAKRVYNKFLKKNTKGKRNNQTELSLDKLPKTRHVEMFGKNEPKPFGWINVSITDFKE